MTLSTPKSDSNSHPNGARFTPQSLARVSHRLREVTHVVWNADKTAIGVQFETPNPQQLIASLPPLYPEWLGGRNFGEAHGLRFPYVAGAMANGIATVSLVKEMAKVGMLGFFGAAGLSVDQIAKSIEQLSELDQNGQSWGSNLIHAPNEPDVENATADLYIQRGVRRVSAAAYMKLTPAVVRYALHGLHQTPDGSIARRNHLFAKISRPEVAQHFMSPAPSEMVQHLLKHGLITPEEARLAPHVAVAEDFTVESDSGGHTDNQALSALFPTISELRSSIQRKHGYQRPIRLGAAGGIGTPRAVAAAFALGADYVLTGSVNQGCVESGLHPSGKMMLAKAGLADVVMAPAADMFELGVEVQVLKRGSMFGVRAKKLYDLYRQYSSLFEIPSSERQLLEKSILKTSIDEAWAATHQYWANRDPREVDRALLEPKHQMALVFRSYLGQSSKWAIAGQSERQLDYQIWCGPAMGAFNAWSAGSFFDSVSNRRVAQVALNLMEGAAIITRAQQLRSFGVALPLEAFDVRPQQLAVEV